MSMHAESQMGTLELSFVVPCHNEEQGLEELTRRVGAAARDLVLSFELVLVDDGSTDGTWSALRRLAKEHPEVVAVRLSRSFGQQAALAAGLSAARGNRVLTLDADLQDPPELLGEFMAKMDKGAEVVHGRRRSRMGETMLKRAEAATFYRIMNCLSDTRIEPDCGEFRLYSRRAVDTLSGLREGRRFLRGLASWIGFKQAVVEYDRPARGRGATKFGLGTMLRLAGDALVGFSIRPLRLAILFALACGTFAGVMGAFGLWALSTGHASAAWALAAALVTGLAAMQLLALGFIGEYLGRLYEQSLGRPTYIVEAIVAERTRVGVAHQGFTGVRGLSNELTDETAWEGHLPCRNGDQRPRDEGVIPACERLPGATYPTEIGSDDPAVFPN